mmetsp:Transcript_21734/g.61492  ORF Transcript_21734/g.61492 Transcript_21734/m.61492 type:complete len:322 (+) Transcript_21734:328-1293(+)
MASSCRSRPSLRSQTWTLWPLQVTRVSPPGATAASWIQPASVNNSWSGEPSRASQMIADWEFMVNTRPSLGKDWSSKTESVTVMEKLSNSCNFSPEEAFHVKVRPSLVVVTTMSPAPRAATPVTQSTWSSCLSIEHEDVFQIWALLSRLPVITRSPVGKIAAVMMGRSMEWRVHNALPVVASQTVGQPEKPRLPQVSTLSPAGNTSTSFAQQPARTLSLRPDSASHTMQLPDSPHVTTRSPSGNGAALVTEPPPWSKRCSNRPDTASQTMVAPSLPQVNTRAPSGKKLKPVTSSSWPTRTTRGPPGLHKVTEMHSAQEATR